MVEGYKVERRGREDEVHQTSDASSSSSQILDRSSCHPRQDLSRPTAGLTMNSNFELTLFSYTALCGAADGIAYFLYVSQNK